MKYIFTNQRNTHMSKEVFTHAANQLTCATKPNQTKPYGSCRLFVKEILVKYYKEK